MKDLMDIYRKMISEGIITNDMLEVLSEIDGMGSATSITWIINTCKDILKKIDRGEDVYYNDEKLDRISLSNILREYLSDYVVSKIYN